MLKGFREQGQPEYDDRVIVPFLSVILTILNGLIGNNLAV